MGKAAATLRSRLEFVDVPPTHVEKTFRQAVLEGLSAEQKSIPSRFFYDERGSHLFERIMSLPEYYLTPAEQAILSDHASEMVRISEGSIAIVEFGSGNSCKTRLILEAALSRQQAVRYIPIDISSEFLEASSLSLLGDYRNLSITALASEYFDAIPNLPQTEEPRLILFMGSNIGNFEDAEADRFLSSIRSRMTPSDRILVGVDRVKDRSVIEAAYNDSEGVTAAFNKNILRRVNTELGGDFELGRFEHWAPFVEDKSQIEMRLVSLKDQTVHISALQRDFEFNKGEYIHTENSRKFSDEAFAKMAERAGLAIENRWTDANRFFSVCGLRKA